MENKKKIDEEEVPEIIPNNLPEHESIFEEKTFTVDRDLGDEDEHWKDLKKEKGF